MNLRVFGCRKSPANKRCQGFTLVEVLVASGIVAIGVASVFTVSHRNLQVMRAARESASVSQILQQRAEQLHIASYETVTNTSGALSLTTLMNVATDSEKELSNLSSFREEVVVHGIDGWFNNKSISVVRNQNGAQVGESGNLSGEREVRVTLEVQWMPRLGNSVGKTLKRQFTTVLSGKGIRAGNIVTSTSGPGVAFTPSPTPFPVYSSDGTDDSGETTPTATPYPSPSAFPSPTPTPVITPTPTPTPVPEVPDPDYCKHGRPWPHCGQP